MHSVSNEVEQALEALDQIVTSLMLGTEKKCHKLHSEH